MDLLSAERPSSPPYTLYPDQEHAVKAILAAIDRGLTSGLVVCPTGTGKTTIANEVVRQLDRKTLALAHRTVLCEQFVGRARLFCPHMTSGIEAGSIYASGPPLFM